MARLLYGCTAADYTITSGGRVIPNTELTVWDAIEGGTQITDLTDYDGNAVGTVTSEGTGFVRFYGPDGENDNLWLDSGQNSRVLVRPTVITAEIADGSILDEDINAAANIARSKIAGTALTTSSTGVFSVLDYGATGDGTTDDTTAVGAALSALLAAPDHGTLWFPPGTYKILSDITITEGLVLAGGGPDSILTFVDSGLIFDCTAAPIYHTRVQGLTIQRTGTVAGAAVWLKGYGTNGLARFIFDDVHLSSPAGWTSEDGYANAGDGLLMEGSYGGLFTFCGFTACKYGVRGITDPTESTGQNSMTFIDPWFAGNHHGWHFDRLVACRIAGGSTEGNAASGGKLTEAVYGVNIIGHYFEGNAGPDLEIDLTFSGPVTVTGNYFNADGMDKSECVLLKGGLANLNDNTFMNLVYASADVAIRVDEGDWPVIGTAWNNRVDPGVPTVGYDAGGTGFTAGPTPEAGSNGLVLTSDDGEIGGMKWSAYGIADLAIGTVTTGTAGATLTGDPEDGYELDLVLPSAGANGVNTAAIQDSAVTSAKIATDAVGSSHIAADAVGASELANNAVDTAAIADGAVTAAKLAVQPGNLLTENQAKPTTTGAYLLDAATEGAAGVYTAVGAGAMIVATSAPLAATAGESCTALATLSMVGRSASVAVQFLNSGGSAVGGFTQGSTVAAGTTGESRLTVVAPATAVSVNWYVYTGTGSGGDTVTLTKASLHRGAGGQWQPPGVPPVGTSRIAVNNAVDLSGTGTPEGVITAAPGSTWLQTDSTTDVKGWIRWVKASGTGNTGWQVDAEYDSGSRNLAAVSMSNSWAVSGALFTLQRVGRTVSIDAAFTKASASADAAYTLPAGFRPQQATVRRIANTDTADDFVTVSITSAGVISIVRSSMSSDIVYASLSFLCAAAAPSSLPGSAA